MTMSRSRSAAARAGVGAHSPPPTRSPRRSWTERYVCVCPECQDQRQGSKGSREMQEAPADELTPEGEGTASALRGGQGDTGATRLPSQIGWTSWAAGGQLTLSKEVSELRDLGRYLGEGFSGRGRAHAKAVGQDCTWCVGGTVRRRLCLEQSERGREARGWDSSCRAR